MLDLFCYPRNVNAYKFTCLWIFLSLSTMTKGQHNLDSMLSQTGVFDLTGKYEEMLELSLRVESLVLESSVLDSLKLCESRGQKAKALYHLERYSEALDAFSKAVSSAPNTDKGKSRKGEILFDRAFMEYDLQQELSSYKTTKEAERILSTVEEPDYDYLLSIYTDLAQEAAKFGYYEEGVYYLDKGMKLYEENKYKVFYLNAKEAITKPVLFQYTYIYLYSYARNEEKMLFHLNQLQSLKNTKEFTPTEELIYAVSLNFVGDYYLVIAGDMYFGKQKERDFAHLLNRADYFLSRALKHLDKDAFSTNYLQFRFNQAKKHLFARELNQAEAINKEILSAIPENDGRRGFFIAQKGLILLARKDKSQVSKVFFEMVEAIHTGTEKIKPDFSNFKPSPNINHAGLLTEMADRLSAAYPQDSSILQQASQMYAIALTQFVNCYQGKGFNKKLKEYYEGAVGGVLKMNFLGFGDDSMLPHYLNEIENIENHFAWQEFSQNQQSNSFILPDSLRYQEVVLRQKLVEARKRKDQLLTFELEDQLNKLKSHIKDKFPKLFSFAYDRFDYKLLREDLSPNTLVLRYKKFQEKWYVFVISEGGLTLAQLYEADILDQQIVSYIHTLTSMEDNEDLGKWLFEKLVPVSIDKKEYVVVIPDGQLRQLPFETLMRENGDYLIEHISISYAPHLIFSTNTFFKSNKEAQGEGIMIFAPTYEGNQSSEVATRQLAYKLAGAEKEASHLADNFWGEYFEGERASKENFMEYAPEAQVLHLSMHANIDQEVPELSYLLFSDKQEQGKMYVEELYAMNLNAKMAVLSACNTGKGLLNIKKGFTSIHQAFTFAGVPTTLSSLWEVPDQTTEEIMTSFYEYLQEGFSKSTALQKAKIDYIQNCQDPNFNKPFFWAGFVLNGNDSPLSLTSRSFIYWVLFLILGLSVVWGFWIKLSIKNRQWRI